MRRLGQPIRRLRVAWKQLVRPRRPAAPATRSPRTLVVLLDGTLSTLQPGCETNIGLIRALLEEINGQISIYYEPGIQWGRWTSTADVISGRGINRQIRRAYGFLASRYRPGDRIFLLGYSRGAYAVRSLAGVIDNVGLLTPGHATERNVRQAWRLYESQSPPAVVADFRARRCHPEVPIEMLGVFDTVKALGLRLPLLWRLTEKHHQFHNDQLVPSVRHGFHALALNETRVAFTPVLWRTTADTLARVEQVWFRGTHGDIGGQLGGFAPARGLSNIPLVWMLEQAEQCGLTLPRFWRRRFPCDPTAPSSGSFRGLGWMFMLRRPRAVLVDPSERIHESVPPWALPRRVRRKLEAMAAGPVPAAMAAAAPEPSAGAETPDAITSS